MSKISFSPDSGTSADSSIDAQETLKLGFVLGHRFNEISGI